MHSYENILFCLVDAQQAGDEAGQGDQEVQLQAGDGHKVHSATLH